MSWLLALLWLAPPVLAQEDDPLALAALLISDGYWDRAERVLSEVDPQARELDLQRYHTLQGLLHLRAERWELAEAELSRALALGATEPRLKVNLARAQLSQEKTDAVLATLDSETELLYESYLLRAAAHRQQGDLDSAWDDLEQGAARHPDIADFDRHRLMLLVELGLYQQARILGQELLAAREQDTEAWLFLAEALARSEQPEQAAVLLEEARLRFPEDPEVPTLLARVYLEAGQPMSAGMVLQLAAERQPELAFEAAECFRMAGQWERAMMLNARVLDPERKTRQRLGLLLEAERWEQVTALQERASRLGLLRDDEIRYGIAYAHFMQGDAAATEALLGGIQEPAWFERATALREALASCVETGSCA